MLQNNPELKSKINQIAVVGAPHEVYSEGIIAFVEPVEGVTLTVEEVMAACQDISAYSRPSHVEILPAGQFPYVKLRGPAAIIGLTSAVPSTTSVPSSFSSRQERRSVPPATFSSSLLLSPSPSRAIGGALMLCA